LNLNELQDKNTTSYYYELDTDIIPQFSINADRLTESEKISQIAKSKLNSSATKQTLIQSAFKDYTHEPMQKRSDNKSKNQQSSIELDKFEPK